MTAMTTSDPRAQPADIRRRAPRRVSRRPGRIVGVAVMTVLSLTAVYPLVFVIGTAFKTDDAYGKSPTSLPLHPVFTFLRQAWSTNGVRALANSALVVIPAVAVVVLVSVPAAYALMHMRWAGQRLFLLGMIGMMTVPTAVLMVPLFRLVSQLGLVNSRLGVVLVYSASTTCRRSCASFHRV
jgi:ABC-type glycerol-3-phosphate transport system permease component